MILNAGYAFLIAAITLCTLFDENQKQKLGNNVHNHPLRFIVGISLSNMCWFPRPTRSK